MSLDILWKRDFWQVRRAFGISRFTWGNRLRCVVLSRVTDTSLPMTLASSPSCHTGLCTCFWIRTFTWMCHFAFPPFLWRISFSWQQSPECDCLCVCLGFTTQQAEIIVSALVKIVEANMSIVYKDMVTKMQQVSLVRGTLADLKSKGGMLFVIYIFW